MKISNDLFKRDKNNFDFIRLLAASFVLIGHAPIILYNKKFDWDLSTILFNTNLHTLGVYIFFIISGFLVCKSWEAKRDIIDFFLGRVLRIFPALIGVVLLSVFVLGTLLTTSTLNDYFQSALVHKYLQNMTVFRMYYYLPGVFAKNPSGGSINGSLWTLPYEFTCYLFLAFFGFLRLLKSQWLTLGMLISLSLVYYFFPEEVNKVVIPKLGVDLKHFAKLFLLFFAGANYYLFKDKITFNYIGLAIASVITLLINFSFLPDLLQIITLPYFVLYVAFAAKIKLYKLAQYGDFSYGIYLYAFPVQQLLVSFLPQSINLWLMVAVSMIFTLVFAVLSWHIVEKPALKLRAPCHTAYKAVCFSIKKAF